VHRGDAPLVFSSNLWHRLHGATQFPRRLVVEQNKKNKSALLDKSEVLDLLKDAIARAGSQSAWARETGIHRTALSAVLNGRKGLQPKIITALGLQKVEAYTRV
jgi:hypothetical protein